MGFQINTKEKTKIRVRRDAQQLPGAALKVRSDREKEIKFGQGQCRRWRFHFAVEEENRGRLQRHLAIFLQARARYAVLLRKLVASPVRPHLFLNSLTLSKKTILSMKKP